MVEEETEEQINDVVVCDRSTINALIGEIEKRREADLWIACDSKIKPSRSPEFNEELQEVLIHHRRPDSGNSVTIGCYLHSLDQWRFRGENFDSTDWVIGWQRLPSPKYGTGSE